MHECTTDDCNECDDDAHRGLPIECTASVHACICADAVHTFVQSSLHVFDSTFVRSFAHAIAQSFVHVTRTRHRCTYASTIQAYTSRLGFS
jgi:hypothetical protein